MNLGDSFPEELRKEFSERKVTIGTVIKLFVHDTFPPKEKRMILVSHSFDKFSFASIYINTKGANQNLLPDIQALHLPLTAEEREYLEHDSYTDCSHLHEAEASELLKAVKDDPKIILGDASVEDLTAIRDTIKQAKTIPIAKKKHYGLYL